MKDGMGEIDDIYLQVSNFPGYFSMAVSFYKERQMGLEKLVWNLGTFWYFCVNFQIPEKLLHKRHLFSDLK